MGAPQLLRRRQHKRGLATMSVSEVLCARRILASMARRSAGRLQVMAGGGLRITDIPAAKRSGIDAVHLSAKQKVSTSARGALSLGAWNGTDPTAYYVTEAALVRAARTACG
jgi:copper homeostasis protein